MSIEISVFAELVKRKMAVQTMKPFCGGGGIILKSGAIQNPIDRLDYALYYALDLPTDVVTGRHVIPNGWAMTIRRFRSWRRSPPGRVWLSKASRCSIGETQ